MSIIVEIFDPALCCPTGVCGPSVDPELTRIARDLNTLKKKGIDTIRHNLSQDAEPYVANELINKLLEDEGTAALPATLVNGVLMKKSIYPTTKELASWVGIEEEQLKAKQIPTKIDIQIN